MSGEPLTIDQLRHRVEGVRIAMATTIDAQGQLTSRPLAVHRIDERGDVYFVVERDADWVVGGQPMNVALVDEGRTWVSVVGRAEYVLGTSLVSDLWDELTDTYLPDGPESAVALQVHADRWEYWTAPNKLAQMAQMAKAFLMDTQPDIGDSGSIET